MAKTADITFAASSVNDGEPLAIAGYRDVRGRARQGYRFVEHPALAVAEEDRNGLPGGIARIPRAPRPFSHPAGGVGGIRRCRPAIGKTVRLSSTIAKLSALWAGVNPRMSPQNASPERDSVRIAGERYGGARPAERPVRRERQLKDGS